MLGEEFGGSYSNHCWSKQVDTLYLQSIQQTFQVDLVASNQLKFDDLHVKKKLSLI